MLRVSAILMLMLAALSARAEEVAGLRAGIEEFTAAYQAWDGARFAAAAELFRRAATNRPANATHFYWLGAAEFHLLLQLRSRPAHRTNETAAKSALEEAVNALKLAVKSDESHAESHALLATLYGMKIDGSLLRAARFGRQVAKHQELALQNGEANPRVRYLLGMCQFHTASKPAAWREALTTLLQAEKLFETEAKTAPAPLAPRWGHDSCLTFIGRAYEALGQTKEAAAYFRKALTVHPQDHVAREGLKRVAETK